MVLASAEEPVLEYQENIYRPFMAYSIVWNYRQPPSLPVRLFKVPLARSDILHKRPWGSQIHLNEHSLRQTFSRTLLSTNIRLVLPKKIFFGMKYSFLELSCYILYGFKELLYLMKLWIKAYFALLTEEVLDWKLWNLDVTLGEVVFLHRSTHFSILVPDILVD